MAQIVARDSAACDAILLGRHTFEDFRGFWPQQTEDTTGGVTYAAYAPLAGLGSEQES